MANKKYNSYIVKGKVVEVYYNNKSGTFLCDLEDWEEYKHLCWVKGNDGYPITRLKNGRNSRFHNLVMNTTINTVCDHISRDRSDNRKSNLRVVTPLENSQNNSIRSDNKSGCVGVSYYEKLKKYRAYININGKQKSLGYFKNFEDAVKVRLKAGEKYNIHTDLI